MALPFLDAMVPALSVRARAAAPANRFQTFYVPNGMAMEYWTPKGVGSAFELSPILEPLAQFRNQTVVLTGLDATWLVTRIAGKGKQSVKLPLACFTARGLKLDHMDTPFAISASAPFAAAIANIEIAGGAATAPDAVRCEELTQEN